MSTHMSTTAITDKIFFITSIPFLKLYTPIKNAALQNTHKPYYISVAFLTFYCNTDTKKRRLHGVF